jgi:hypothetical protein
MTSKYILELKEIIHKLHGVRSKHVETVSMKETFRGKTVWDGFVEVFELYVHPKAPKVNAWAHETDDPKKPVRHVTVLHVEPVTSPKLAVRAFIVQEYRNAEAAES